MRIDLTALVRASLLVLPLAACSTGEGDPTAPREDADAAAALVVVAPEHPDSPTDVDLGELDFGEVVAHTVRLRNASAQPLTIRSIQPGCSCTSSRISYAAAGGETVVGDTRSRGDVLVLPAGFTADLTLKVDTTIAPVKNKPKNVLVRITTDSLVTPYLTLNVHMLVTSSFRPAPAVIDLRQAALNGIAEGEVVLASDNVEGRRVLGVLSTPPQVEAEVAVDHVQGGELWTVTARLLPPLAPGFQEHELLLRTSGPGGQGEGRPFAVQVRAIGVPDVLVEPPVILLAAAEPGAPLAGEARLVTRLSGHALSVERALLSGPSSERLRVELEPQSPEADGRAAVWGVRVVATEALGAAPLSGELALETDDPQNPRLVARWYYRP